MPRYLVTSSSTDYVQLSLLPFGSYISSQAPKFCLRLAHNLHVHIQVSNMCSRHVVPELHTPSLASGWRENCALKPGTVTTFPWQ